ncbi:hypothetical protein EPUS_05746 [Endocarpon pusillum Z07020]|uniref:Major facilitator superfamily (MFS) profile domain-containing protein n=1 Tax=Endocarpon pusillum (strain Z07020 / HMAS-L-300199) TaxID=1263415 RepID=U1HF47_ENDPU|nr:uncharacterized protein EPUS_05746 [Endocarpon pusillum Z07020]ERF68685.1 hypothetical protein EPUS_05746 [Endocarpon pusillum Z07020]
MANWRYLFVIEGCCTVALFLFCVLVPALQRGRGEVSERGGEEDCAFYRMQVDSSSVVNEKFNFKQAVTIFKHPTSWVILAIEIGLGVPLQSTQLFLPVIIARLGYSTVKTNLHAVAPNISGAIIAAPPRLRLRPTRASASPFVALGFFFTFTGFVIYSAIDVEKSPHGGVGFRVIMSPSLDDPHQEGSYVPDDHDAPASGGSATDCIADPPVDSSDHQELVRYGILD